MAVKRKAAGDGGLGQLKEALSSGSLGTVYLFHGEESYLREYYLSEMKNSGRASSPCWRIFPPTAVW